MTVKEIEDSISELPPLELARLREWFWKFDAANWDKQFENDVAAGRLDSLADAAISEHRAGSHPLAK